jgi:homoserine kinase
VRLPAGPVTVSVPATSANLGPGFDALGLALALYDVVEARILDSGLVIEVSGAGREAAAAGEDYLVIRAMRAAFDVLGGQPPGIGIRCANAIPQGFGLGSSAGAVVAGLLAARALAAQAAMSGSPGQASSPGTVRSPGEAGLDDAAVLRLAAQLEGHPDNAAACLAGGLTIAWQSAAGTRLASLSPLAGLAPLICIPAAPLATEAARQVLPPTVPHADAAANSARTALLVAALTGDAELLMDATQDFLHQGYRTAAMPGTMHLIARLRAAGIPAVVSGAGPAVLALAVPGTHPGPDAVTAVASETGAAWKVLPLAVDRQGATIRPARLT